MFVKISIIYNHLFHSCWTSTAIPPQSLALQPKSPGHSSLRYGGGGFDGGDDGGDGGGGFDGGDGVQYSDLC